MSENCKSQCTRHRKPRHIFIDEYYTEKSILWHVLFCIVFIGVTLHPGLLTLTHGGGSLCVLMTQRAMLVRTSSWWIQPYQIGRGIETRQRTAPGPPGWGLDVRLITYPRKTELITETLRPYAPPWRQEADNRCYYSTNSLDAHIRSERAHYLSSLQNRYPAIQVARQVPAKILQFAA